MVESLKQSRNVAFDHLPVGEHRRRALGERASQELGRLCVDRRSLVLQSLENIFLHGLDADAVVERVDGLYQRGHHVRLLLFEFLQHDGETLRGAVLKLEKTGRLGLANCHS